MKNRKVTDHILLELSFLTSWELQKILSSLSDSFQGDRYDTLDHISRCFTDSEIKPLLPEPPPLILQDKRPVEEKLKDIQQCYKITENIDNPSLVESVIRKKGRKKSTETLKNRVFKVLDNNYELNETTEYDDILKSGIINIAENTFKTILSQWRKEKGIKVKRGRKSGVNNDQ